MRKTGQIVHTKPFLAFGTSHSSIGEPSAHLKDVTLVSSLYAVCSTSGHRQVDAMTNAAQASFTRTHQVPCDQNESVPPSLSSLARKALSSSCERTAFTEYQSTCEKTLLNMKAFSFPSVESNNIDRSSTFHSRHSHCSKED